MRCPGNIITSECAGLVDIDDSSNVALSMPESGVVWDELWRPCVHPGGGRSLVQEALASFLKQASAISLIQHQQNAESSLQLETRHFANSNRIRILLYLLHHIICKRKATIPHGRCPTWSYDAETVLLWASSHRVLAQAPHSDRWGRIPRLKLHVI